MMGKDCERILSNILKINDLVMNLLSEVTALNSVPILVDASHTHGEDGQSSVMNFIEHPTVSDVSGLITPIQSLYDEMVDDFDKLDFMKSRLYVDTTTFNNSGGSPWSEISRFKSNLDGLCGSSSPAVNGERGTLASLSTVTMLSGFDAKWALIMYNDYIQRGYDMYYNDNEPSISFKVPDNELDTIGNIHQDFDENVNIKKPSLDPF